MFVSNCLFSWSSFESSEMNSYSDADKNLGRNCMIRASHVGQYYYLITSLVENFHVLCLISDSKFLGALIVFCSIDRTKCPANEVSFVSRALVQGGDRNHRFLLYICPWKRAVKAAAEPWWCQTRSCSLGWGVLPKAAGANTHSGFYTLPPSLEFVSWEEQLEKNVCISPHRGESLEWDVGFRADKRNK